MKKIIIILIPIVLFLAVITQVAQAQSISIPQISIGGNEIDEPEEVATTLKVVFILTILTVAPSILVMMTSFTRIMIVFSFLRQAMHTQQSPSNQILAGMALFLTFYIMSPVWNDINDNALKPYLAEEISYDIAFEKAKSPIRDFMLKQTREKDLALLITLSKGKRPNSSEEIPFTTILPAFMISEVTTAFSIGFILFLPFLIIDMVIACVLLSMGMMMLPPIMVSLPFKLLLFVLVDGWNLLIGSVVKSFH